MDCKKIEQVFGGRTDTHENREPLPGVEGNYS